MRGFLKIIFRRAARGPGLLCLLSLAGLFMWALLTARAAAGQEQNKQALTLQPSFAGKPSVAPDEPIELTLNRPLAQSEGRLAVIVGATDLTDLFIVSARSLKYGVKSFPLPLGDTELTVDLVAQNDEWKELARFPLRVANNAAPGNSAPGVSAPSNPAPGVTNAEATAENTAAKSDSAEAKAEESDAKAEAQPATDASAKKESAPQQAPQQAEPPAKRRFGFDKFDLAPQFNIGFKSQFAELRF